MDNGARRSSFSESPHLATLEARIVGERCLAGGGNVAVDIPHAQIADAGLAGIEPLRWKAVGNRGPDPLPDRCGQVQGACPVTAHLLAISLGPVQGFIASARRSTRDLWCGSDLLSEVSKAAAKAVHDACTCPRRRPDLSGPGHPGDLAPDSPRPASGCPVANIILAELRDVHPATVAQAARAAARSHWRQVADAVYHDHRSVIQREIWADQVNDVIEFYAAWVPLADDYPECRRYAMRLLGGRKNCRDFLPAKGRGAVPKSPDGLRESVLKDPQQEPWPQHHRRRLRLKGRRTT